MNNMFSEIKLLLFFSSSFFSFVCSVTTSQMSYNRLIEVFVTFELQLSERMEGIILVFSLKYVERFLVHITKLYNLRITWLLFFLYFWASKIKRIGFSFLVLLSPTGSVHGFTSKHYSKVCLFFLKFTVLDQN